VAYGKDKAADKTVTKPAPPQAGDQARRGARGLLAAREKISSSSRRHREHAGDRHDQGAVRVGEDDRVVECTTSASSRAPVVPGERDEYHEGRSPVGTPRPLSLKCCLRVASYTTREGRRGTGEAMDGAELPRLGRRS